MRLDNFFMFLIQQDNVRRNFSGGARMHDGEDCDVETSLSGEGSRIDNIAGRVLRLVKALWMMRRL